MKKQVAEKNAAEKARELRSLYQIAKDLTVEAEQELPDVFIWMMSDQTRIAYARFPARHIIHNDFQTIRGKNCSKIQTFFLKVPLSHHLSFFKKFAR